MNGIVEINKDINRNIKQFSYNKMESSEINFTSIVILTYNQLEYTKLCIDSIRTFTDKDRYEIIIVDNNSSDGTVKWLKEQDDLRVIYNDENKGFPAGCNQGINIAKGENILLLNNDVIVTPNWLYNLDKALWSDEKVGAVGAVSNSCSYYQQIDVSYNNIHEMLDFAYNYNKSDELYWKYRTKLIGFCMLIKKSVLDEIGLLDEIFTPGNFEDDDISFRMICNGYKLILCQDTFIHHFGSVSFGKLHNEYYNILDKNADKFSSKWKFNPRYSNMIRFDMINLINDDRENNINVLEIGCGTGATLLEIKSRYTKSDIYGIEICEGPAKIAKNVANVIEGDIESIKLPYEKKFFDYIILGDVLEHLNNPWDTLNKLREYLKKDGFIIASIPNIMHASVMKELANGNFVYTDAGILDRTHLRFFTLTEIEKLFSLNKLHIDKITAVNIGLQQEEEIFVNNMCSLYGEHLRVQYNAYQYIIKANKTVDYNKYNSKEMIEFKYNIMRIDNDLDVENSIDYVISIARKDDEIIDDIQYLLNQNIVNKEKVLNKIATKAYEIGLYEFSISLLMLALKINRDNIDTVYNLGYILNRIGEYELALSILENSGDNVKSDTDILNMISTTRENYNEK